MGLGSTTPNSNTVSHIWINICIIQIKHVEFEVCNTTRSTITEEPFSRYSESPYTHYYVLGFSEVHSKYTL